MLIGRENEKKELLSVMNSDSSEFVAVDVCFYQIQVISGSVPNLPAMGYSLIVHAYNTYCYQNQIVR